MGAIIIISVNTFLQFVYAFVLAKLEKNFKSFMPNHALQTINQMFFLL